MYCKWEKVHMSNYSKLLTHDIIFVVVIVLYLVKVEEVFKGVWCNLSKRMRVGVQTVSD